MSESRIDHLVVAAATLEQGVEYLETMLGVRLPAGGKHPRMATHNHLMKLGDDLFLEVIAIDPAAKAPSRPRWFGLDDGLVRKSLQQSPRLLTWAVNVPDLLGLQSLLAAEQGVIEPMSRGSLNWMISIPADGQLPAGGMLPTLLQWHTEQHPAGGMSDLGCRLQKLTLYHPYPEWLSERLKNLGVDSLVDIEPLATTQTPYLSVLIDTPLGVRELSSAIG